MGRGSLRIYLGAAPGVGKTVAMLDEAHRRLSRGTDVVVGYVETHGRSHTAAMLEGLEVLPRRTVEYRGNRLTELDVAAVLARHPHVVLVDELAHTNVPGSGAPSGGGPGDALRDGHEKRWQDVEEILEAGIDVISTVNIQHLESLNDVVESITGIRQQETVPDEVVRRADQVELVDMSPEALRRRMAHGNIYGPDKVDAALANYFRTGNLSALREIALLWLADRVDEALERYRADQGISEQWPTRERVVVALTGGAGSETLLRRHRRPPGPSRGVEGRQPSPERHWPARPPGRRGDAVRRRRPRRADRRARRHPGGAHALARPAPLPRADRRVRPRGWHLAGALLRRRRLARRQLVLHRATGHAHHQ